MKYKATPLFYGANENFKGTVRFVVELKEDVDFEPLRYAVEQVKKRYPYFSVQIKEENEAFVLVDNDRPFVISLDGASKCLNSEESNYHLVAFGLKDNRIFVDFSHLIADGNGITPLVKTLLYYYIENKDGTDVIDTEDIRLVSDSVLEEEYIYPFPDEPIVMEDAIPIKPKEYDPLTFDDAFFDDGGPYAYHLQVRQEDLMKYAKINDCSPVSFIGVMMYKALMSLFPETEKDILIEIPHEYRKALGRPLSHDSLVRVFVVRLTPKDQSKDIEMLNTAIRGQIVLGGDVSQDIEAINGLIQMDGYLKNLSLLEKKQALWDMLSNVMAPHTTGISYTGNISWGGMDKYLKDVYPYAGENKFSGSIGVEVFSFGDYFSINVMQPGENPALIQEMINAFNECGIKCNLSGEERYALPDYLIP